MNAGLPRGIAALVRLVVPARTADHVVAELAEEYARLHGSASSRRARWWLLRETTSIVVAYLVAPVAGIMDTRSLWIRDVRLVFRGLRRGLVPAVGAAALLSIGLLAVLLTAGLSSTLLFRSVSVTHGASFRRVSVVDRRGQTSLRVSFIELQAIRDHLEGVAEVTAVNMQPVIIRTARRSEEHSAFFPSIFRC